MTDLKIYKSNIPSIKKENRKCEFCGLLMNATKIGQGNFSLYRYECPNKCLDKYLLEQEKNNKYKENYRRAKKLWKKVGFSRECIGWNLNKMTCENIGFLRQYAENFNKFSKSLVLKGFKGTGKSLSSECIAKIVLKKGYNVRITNMTEINLEMNIALRKDKYFEYLEHILKYDLLIIDDFGREQYTTEKSLENVFQFFNTLTKEHKPFIVSINPEMLAIIAQKPQLDACLDRFKKSSRVKILEFTNKSFRK